MVIILILSFQFNLSNFFFSESPCIQSPCQKKLDLSYVPYVYGFILSVYFLITLDLLIGYFFPQWYAYLADESFQPSELSQKKSDPVIRASTDAPE